MLQCSVAEAALIRAYAAAMPCDDDCPAVDVSDGCGACLGDGADATADILLVRIAACEPEPDPAAADKATASGTAGLMVSLALAYVSVIATQL